MTDFIGSLSTGLIIGAFIALAVFASSFAGGLKARRMGGKWAPIRTKRFTVEFSYVENPEPGLQPYRLSVILL